MNEQQRPKLSIDQSGHPSAGLIEGQTLEGEYTLKADVCVIGSGAGGAVAAARFARAGLKVLILEEGGYFTQRRFRMQERDAYPQLYQEGAQRATRDLAVTILQGRAVGGTTVVNWTTCFRTPERIIEHWHRAHAVEGISHQALQKPWAEVEARLNIDTVAEPLVNRNNRILEAGCRALGFPVEALRRNVRGCASTGYCGVGCPIDAKQSMALSYIPDAINASATLISRARVQRLDWKSGRVNHAAVHLLDATGRFKTGARLKVEATRFILSGGAINSPALLLRSGAPDPHDRLGRQTTLHPGTGALGLHKEPVHPYHGAPQSRASHAFHERDDRVGFLIEAAPLHPVLAATSIAAFGGDHQAHMEQLSHLSVSAAFLGDGLHEGTKGGRVTVDSDGHPVVDYPLTETHWEAYRAALKALARIQLAAGAERVFSPHDPLIELRSEADLHRIDEAPMSPGSMVAISFHQMGGCAMGDDPRRAVVRSEDLRHHQLENLHIIDGSVFPTSVTVNPSLSIYGVSQLISDRLAARWSTA
ncbi:MAG: GMC family oxidoreductase [Myxococcota bacterium]|nr:GMC family oxidoreductase [Myxococcota bacterium]